MLDSLIFMKLRLFFCFIHYSLFCTIAIKFYIFVWIRYVCSVHMRLNLDWKTKNENHEYVWFLWDFVLHCTMAFNNHHNASHRNSKQRKEQAICSSKNFIGVFWVNDRWQIEHWTFDMLYFSGVFLTRFDLRMDLRRAHGWASWFLPLDSKSWWRVMRTFRSYVMGCRTTVLEQLSTRKCDWFLDWSACRSSNDFWHFGHLVDLQNQYLY